MRMKNLLKSVGYTVSIALVAGFVAATPANASYENVYNNPNLFYVVDKQHKLSLNYDVYAGGFKALNASLMMDLDKKAYDMTLEAETQGFIASIFPWKASFNTSGHAEKGTLTPTIYRERNSWRKGVKITEMSYAPDGKVLKTTTQADGKTTTDRDINDVLARNSMDLLTGTLIILQSVKNTHKCTGQFPIFDGKHRFNITLMDDGKEILPPSKYSSFEGEALRCTIKVVPVAGFKQKDNKRGWMAVQNHTEAHHKLPTLWLARMKNSTQIVPVRMEIASDYGSVVAHLSKETEN